MIPEINNQRVAAQLRGEDFTKGLAPYLPALITDLVPGALMHLHGTVAQLASEGDDLGNDELRNTS